MNTSVRLSAIAATCAMTFASNSTFAGQILEYVASFEGVSGTYDGDSFDDKTLTFTMVTNTDYIGVNGMGELSYDYPMLLPQGPTLVWASIDGVMDSQVGGVNLQLSAAEGDPGYGTRLLFTVGPQDGPLNLLFVLNIADADPLSALTVPGAYEQIEGYNLLERGLNWSASFTQQGGEVGGGELQIDDQDGDMFWSVLPSNSIGNPVPGIGGVACLAALGVVSRRRR